MRSDFSLNSFFSPSFSGSDGWRVHEAHNRVKKKKTRWNMDGIYATVDVDLFCYCYICGYGYCHLFVILGDAGAFAFEGDSVDEVAEPSPAFLPRLRINPRCEWSLHRQDGNVAVAALRPIVRK